MGSSSREIVRVKERTEASFGYEWSRFGDVLAEYEQNFLDCIWPIGREFFKGKLVLDAGCGAGRNAYFAALWGAHVVAFDLSAEAVKAAIRNIADSFDINVVRADVDNLPANWEGTFDYVFCIGVLHHLPDPQDGFNKLVSALRSGGTLSVWVYGRQDNALATRLFEPLRKLTTRIPHKVLYYLSAVPAAVVELVNRLHLPWYYHYSRFPFRTKWNDAFDMLSAPLAHYHTLEEVTGWFKQAGVKDIQVSHRMMDGVAKGIRGTGVRP